MPGREQLVDEIRLTFSPRRITMACRHIMSLLVLLLFSAIYRLLRILISIASALLFNIKFPWKNIHVRYATFWPYFYGQFEIAGGDRIQRGENNATAARLKRNVLHNVGWRSSSRSG